MTSTIFQPRRAGTALLLAASVLALAAPAAPALASPMDWIAGGSVKGSGKLQEQQRAVGRFNGVALNVPGTVELRIGNTESVTIETDDNLLPLIETVVENGTLRIRQSRRNTNLRQTALKIVVYASNIERISVGGSGTVNASGLFADKLRFDVGGSGSIHAGQLDARLVSVAIGGSGNFSASGKTQQLTASIGGSGNIDAGRLAARDVQVSIGGSGEAEVWAKDQLAISIGGSGEVSYYGDPQISRSMQRSSSVKRLGTAPN